MDIADNQSGDEDDHQGGDDNAYIFKIGDRVGKNKGIKPRDERNCDQSGWR